MAMIFLETKILTKIILLLTIFVCILISMRNPSYNNDNNNNSPKPRISSDQTKVHHLSNHHLVHHASSLQDWTSIPSVSFFSPSLSPENPRFKDDSAVPMSLEYDYYRDSCPRAEKLIRNAVLEVNRTRPDSVPPLLRLAFHDCFVEGCDASLLLDGVDGVAGEKEAPPNVGLKGFDVIDHIKLELEEVCPGVVSCADLLVLAAREAVVVGGGPFYPLYTGRRDSTISFPEVAEYELPSPEDDMNLIAASFATKGFDDREMVAFLGAHNMGAFHCTSFSRRLYNFKGTGIPESSIDATFLKLMKSVCGLGDNAITTLPEAPSPSLSSPVSDEFEMEGDYYGPSTGLEAEAPAQFLILNIPEPEHHLDTDVGSPVFKVNTSAPSVSTQILNITGITFGRNNNASAPQPPESMPPQQSPSYSVSPTPSFTGLPPFSSADESEMKMDYDGPSSGFGTLYYRMLLENKGILPVDQQLTESEETLKWVRVYASDARLFQQDFALAMMKLSHLDVLTAPMGQVRKDCRRVV